MSQITRCPFCATKFKVVADQLRISDGWVRCGQCQQVFDAAQALLQPSDQPAPAVATTAQAYDLGDATAGYELPAPVDDEEELPLDEEAAFEDEAADLPQEPQFLTESDDLRAAQSESAAAEPAKTVEPDAELVFAADADLAPDSDAEPDSLPEALPLDAAQPLSAVEPSFVRTARRKAFWQRPGVRAGLGLACLGLMFVLVVQLALHQRNALAAWQPATRPVLQSLCEWTGCSLSARQDIDQMVIVNSGFLRTEGADHYQFSLTIENQASTELLMPAVELTLTDVQDMPVLRRVLLPAQMRAPSTLAAGAQWSASLALLAQSPDTRIAGYRALVFYP